VSATIRWVQTERGTRLNVNAPSAFIEAMTKAFGSAPWTLGDKAIPILKGMGAVQVLVETEEPYSYLAALIEQNGEIRVWSEW